MMAFRLNKILLRDWFMTGVVVMILLSACLAADHSVTPLPTPVVAVSAAPDITNPTPTNEQPTQTATSTTTALPSATPTATLRPTLSAGEAKNLILELVQHPGDCRLPCLWGFIPGESEYAAAQQFVERFGLGDFRVDEIEIGAHNYDNLGGVGITYPQGDILIVTQWSYYKSKTNSTLGILTLDLRPMEVVGISSTSHLPLAAPKWGDATFSQEFGAYLLPAILAQYGRPTQVLITVIPDEPDDSHNKFRPFSIGLVYAEQGIFVEYEAQWEALAGQYIGCPEKSHIHLTTWDTSADRSWESIVDWAGSIIRLSNSQPLETATELSLDQFVAMFSEPGNSICVQTPVEQWADP